MDCSVQTPYLNYIAEDLNVSIIIFLKIFHFHKKLVVQYLYKELFLELLSECFDLSLLSNSKSASQLKYLMPIVKMVHSSSTPVPDIRIEKYSFCKNVRFF